MRFGDVPTYSGHDYGRSSPKTTATPASGHHRGHAAAHTSRQVVSRLHDSALIFMGPRDIKYDSNSIPNLPYYKSTLVVSELVHILDTYLIAPNYSN